MPRARSDAVGAVAAAALAWLLAAGAGEAPRAEALTGYLQAAYVRSEAGGAVSSEQQRQQLRLALTDRVAPGADWTLEYALDRSARAGSAEAVQRPRYSTTLRGSGYQANLSFHPVRDPESAGGLRTDEWRATMSVSGRGGGQLSFAWTRREDRAGTAGRAGGWTASGALSRPLVSVRTSLQRQEQRGGTLTGTRTFQGRGEVALTPDLGERLRGAILTDLSLSDREGTTAGTSRTRGGSAQLAWTVLPGVEWSASTTLQRGTTRRDTRRSETANDLVSSSLRAAPGSALQGSLDYVRSRARTDGARTRQETVSATLYAREELGPRIAVNGQLNAGRLLASSAGAYGFTGATLEGGGALYRRTTLRVTVTGQRNGRGALPWQLSRQAVVETAPWTRLHLSAWYSAQYAGEYAGILATRSESLRWSAEVRPRGLGSWSGVWTRNWNPGTGTERAMSLYATLSSSRSAGLSLGITRREIPNAEGGVRRSTGLQARADVECRDGLTLGVTREHSDQGSGAETAQWQVNARWMF